MEAMDAGDGYSRDMWRRAVHRMGAGGAERYLDALKGKTSAVVVASLRAAVKEK